MAGITDNEEVFHAGLSEGKIERRWHQRGSQEPVHPGPVKRETVIHTPRGKALPGERMASAKALRQDKPLWTQLSGDKLREVDGAQPAKVPWALVRPLALIPGSWGEGEWGHSGRPCLHWGERVRQAQFSTWCFSFPLPFPGSSPHCLRSPALQVHAAGPGAPRHPRSPVLDQPELGARVRAAGLRARARAAPAAPSAGPRPRAPMYVFLRPPASPGGDLLLADTSPGCW